MSDALINGLAVAGGGIIAQIATHPLKTVATRRQTERDQKKERRRIGTLEQIFQVHKCADNNSNMGCCDAYTGISA